VLRRVGVYAYLLSRLFLCLVELAGALGGFGPLGKFESLLRRRALAALLQNCDRGGLCWSSAWRRLEQVLEVGRAPQCGSLGQSSWALGVPDWRVKRSAPWRILS